MAAGFFSSYTGIPRNCLVRINPNGSIDPTFDPGIGPDSTVMDIAELSGNQFAIGGAFKTFNGFPRYGFAILDSTGKLVSRLGFESFSVKTNLQFGLAVEPSVAFQLQSSPDLLSWQNIYSNSIQQSFTNLELPLPTASNQFYRLVQ
jgi:hypothetical protein